MERPALKSGLDRPISKTTPLFWLEEHSIASTFLFHLCNESTWRARKQPNCTNVIIRVYDYALYGDDNRIESRVS